jgi:ABC-2 type transport system permease protein
VANRRLEVQKANIEDEKRKTIQESKAETELSVRRIQNRVRTLAMLLPPVPPAVLGVVIFLLRRKRENLGANPNQIV